MHCIPTLRPQSLGQSFHLSAVTTLLDLLAHVLRVSIICFSNRTHRTPILGPRPYTSISGLPYVCQELLSLIRACYLLSGGASPTHSLPRDAYHNDRR